ncbi:MAG: energy transducer TonB [Muribaculaceae bacterium]|nr:energy transducer TonB [Muribaculaceae bacterium]
MLKYILLTIVGLITFPLTPDVCAQTCKIRCKKASDGKCVYMEVYEYDYVTEKPMFPGGDSHLVSFINHTRQYPEKAYKRGVTGRVTCSFIVNADGSVSHIRILKGVEPSLNREAIRIFSLMPAWIPGKIDNIAVPVRVIRSIPFRK